MTKVPNPTPSRKVFFAQLEGLSGTIAQLGDGKVYFFHPDSGELRQVDSYRGLTVLGECGLANASHILTAMHGGYAAVACSRQMEVASYPGTSRRRGWPSALLLRARGAPHAPNQLHP